MPILNKVATKPHPWLDRLRVEHKMRAHDIDADEWRENFAANLAKKLTAAQPDGIRKRLNKELRRVTKKDRSAKRPLRRGK